MKPFLLISTRDNDRAALAEYASVARHAGLDPDDLVHVRLEAAPLTDFDLDLDAPFVARTNALRNGIDGCGFWAGILSSLAAHARFDLVVANMLQEEVAPLLPGLAAILPSGGMLVTAGQLAARENEFLTLLAAAGLRARRLASEGEWLGTLSVRE